MLLGLHKNLSFNSGKYPYATGGDYVYLYEEGNKTYRVHEFLSTGTSTLNVEVGGQMEYLIVGGGGGGGTWFGGGGGAGGVLSGTTKLSVQTYSVTVGTGGAAATYPNLASNGGNSTAFGLTSYGGGRGGRRDYVGSDGGSGGGGSRSSGTEAAAIAGGSGTPGQGNDGGYGHLNGSQLSSGGGGGGAGSAGSTSASGVGGDGGDGVEWPIGSGKYYGGGGGGAAGGSGTGGAGGMGGASDGGSGEGVSATDATANTGGGGGGSQGTGSTSGAGGSGIVIVRYVVAEKKLWTPSELDLGSQTAATWVDTSEFSSISSLSPNFTDKAGVVYGQYGNPPIQASLNNNFALDLNTAYAPNGFGNLATGFIDAVILERSAYFVGRAVTTNSTENTGIAGQSEYASANFAIGFKMENTTSASSAPAGTFSLMAECSFAPGFDVVYPIIQLTSKSTNTYLSTSDYHIFCVTTNYSTGDINLYANGSLVASSTGNSETIPNLQRGGGIYKISGTNSGGQTTKRATPIFGEFIVTATDDDQNNSQARIKMEGYLAHKWGLTNNLPAGHPYKYEPPYKVEPEEIVTDGLVLNLDAGDYASYPRSGTTWYDISGNGLNGTLTNGPTYDSANKGSIVFDGVNDYNLLPNLALNYPFTISLWSKGDGYILFSDPTAENKSIGIGFLASVNQIRCHYYSPGTGFVSANESANSTTIYNMCGVYTSSGFDLYVNGQYKSTLGGAKSKVWTDTLGSYNMNRLNRPSVIYYSGNAYACQIYNRALSSTEISQNFNALRGRYGI